MGGTGVEEEEESESGRDFSLSSISNFGVRVRGGIIIFRVDIRV